MNIIEPTIGIFQQFLMTPQDNFIGIFAGHHRKTHWKPMAFGGQTPGFWRVLWGAVLENAQLMGFLRGYIISQLLLRMSNGYIMLYPNLMVI